MACPPFVKLVRLAFLMAFFAVVPFTSVTWGQTTDTSPGTGTVRMDDDDDADDDDGFPWGLLGLLGLLGLAGLKRRDEPVVRTHTTDTHRP